MLVVVRVGVEVVRTPAAVAAVGIAVIAAGVEAGIIGAGVGRGRGVARVDGTGNLPCSLLLLELL